jgi:hypothetical protein
MREWGIAKGRRRVVAKFTVWHGLWVIGILAAALVIMVVLWMEGYLPLDVH